MSRAKSGSLLLRAPHVCACGRHAWAAGGETHVALLDTGDIGEFAAAAWTIVNRRYIGIRSSKNRVTFLHRQLLVSLDGVDVDHINGDGFDNRRSNLRHVTHSANMKNRRLHRHSKNDYKGIKVVRGEALGKYRARVTHNGKKIDGPRRATQLEAALDYDRMAVELHGPFARTNAALGLLPRESKK